MPKLSQIFLSLRATPRRAAAMELCLLTPAVALLSIGLFGVAGYWVIGARIQNVADLAVRAAARSRAPDRADVARRSVQSALQQRGMGHGAAIVSLEEEGPRLSLQLIYDASRSPIFVLDEILPMPSPTIVRYASAPDDAGG